MSEERGARGEARGARPARRSLGEGGFDAAIDRAVREMLDVEPPPGLRGRVMDRIDLDGPAASAVNPHGLVASAFRRKGAWIFVPVAAAAVIALAVTAPWRDAAPARPTAPPAVATVETPRAAPPPVAPKTPEPATPQAPKATSINAARIAVAQPGRLVEAADAAAVEDVNFTAIDALAGPQSIAIERLPDPLPPSMRSIEPAPLQIRALEVTALPDTPRERREE